ncbi:MAG: hypothetical protein LBP94_07200, partial [Zoogloeaceae bacterium]|nr:hypothetical protein [Zoogloeaceae bacterium]
MKNSKPSVRLLLGFIAVVGLIIGLIFIPIPYQKNLVCEFDDGDRMIIRQGYTFDSLAFIYAHLGIDIHPTRSGDSSVYYKPKNGTEERNEITGYGPRAPFTGEDDTGKDWRRTYCSDYRKLDGAISARGKYRLLGADWNSASWSPELWDLRHEKDLFRGNGATFSKINSSSLLFEAPLITYENSLKTVQAVFRSYSHDGGQTWTPLELTKDSK